MKIWIDAEFNEHTGRHELISMALVAEDGREWYAVLRCPFPGQWVAENVMPKLGKEPISREAFVDGLCVFLSQFEAVHIIGDWPSDIALFCDSLIVGPGVRIDTPPLTMEIIRLDGVSADPHNALADARGIRDVHLAALQAKSTTIEPGDHIRHGPSNEEWVVKAVHGDHLEWMGWPPNGRAKVSDCTLLQKAGPKELDLLRQIRARETT